MKDATAGYTWETHPIFSLPPLGPNPSEEALEERVRLFKAHYGEPPVVEDTRYCPAEGHGYMNDYCGRPHYWA